MEKAARRIAGICAAIAVVAAVSCAFAPEERPAEQAGAARSPFGDATADSPAKGGGKPFPYRGTSTPDSRGQGDFSVSAVNRAIGERMRDNPHVTTDARGALSLDSRVLFGYDSAELSEEGRESLTEFLRDYMRAVFDENVAPLAGSARAMMERVRERSQLTEKGDRILTDDRAPVELLGMKVLHAMIREELDY